MTMVMVTCTGRRKKGVNYNDNDEVYNILLINYGGYSRTVMLLAQLHGHCDPWSQLYVIIITITRIVIIIIIKICKAPTPRLKALNKHQ